SALSRSLALNSAPISSFVGIDCALLSFGLWGFPARGHKCQRRDPKANPWGVWGVYLTRGLTLFGGVTTREYLSANFPSRGGSGAPQSWHVRSWPRGSEVSTRTTLYCVPQFQQLERV